MSKVYLADEQYGFEIGQFTVLFGKNNAGKTRILENIYLMLAAHLPGAGEARLHDNGGHHTDLLVGWPCGAVYVDLESDVEFDHDVLESFPRWQPAGEGAVRFGLLPPGQVCYGSADRNRRELWFTDLSEFYQGIYEEKMSAGPDPVYELDDRQRSDVGPFPKPLFLGWEFRDIETWTTAAIAKLTARDDQLGEIDTMLEGIHYEVDANADCRLRPAVIRALEQLASLATDLLPDFLDGRIRPLFYKPRASDEPPRVALDYTTRWASEPVPDFGRGASRWIGIAVRIALQIMEDDTETTSLDSVEYGKFSGHVLFIDEPEAHLHHSAVASIARWCHRMVGTGFNVLAASHHEEFLRAPGEDVTFVKVTRDGRSMTARTVTTAATSTLQQLADEVGMHPAAVLSLHRAILFVEGPLDEAVLDEFAGGRLDAAGVSIIPIHGTKNLEGLIDGEFAARLGIKTGVLTDNTIVATLWDRSNKKRSSEERKLVRLITRFEEQGHPAPKLFGVPEKDLLFALPVEAIRDFVNGPFPGWHELEDECRAALGKGPSDSVDWKTYALEHYRLPLNTADGVRRIVRALDLAGVELTSIRTVVDEIIAWARDT